MKTKPKPPYTGHGAEPWRGRREAWRGQSDADLRLTRTFRPGGYLRTQRRPRRGA
jgi:hypothetical protein